MLIKIQKCQVIWNWGSTIFFIHPNNFPDHNSVVVSNIKYCQRSQKKKLRTTRGSREALETPRACVLGGGGHGGGRAARLRRAVLLLLARHAEKDAKRGGAQTPPPPPASPPPVVGPPLSWNPTILMWRYFVLSFFFFWIWEWYFVRTSSARISASDWASCLPVYMANGVFIPTSVNGIQQITSPGRHVTHVMASWVGWHTSVAV
jgi:hypothetical protein